VNLVSHGRISTSDRCVNDVARPRVWFDASPTRPSATAETTGGRGGSLEAIGRIACAHLAGAGVEKGTSWRKRFSEVGS